MRSQTANVGNRAGKERICLTVNRRRSTLFCACADFCQHISNDWPPPFKTVPLKAEGTIEYQALLFIPAQAPYDLFYHGYHGR